MTSPQHESASSPMAARRPSISIKHRIEYLGFRLAGALFGALSVEQASGLSGKLWRLIAPHLKRHRRARLHIAAAMPELPAQAREAILVQMWENLGRTFAEAFRMADIAREGRITLQQPDVLARVAAQGGAGVFCFGHIGNWEIGGLPATQLGMRPAGIYQKAHNPLVDADILKMRQAVNGGGVWPKDGEGARKMLRHVRDGGALFIMADMPMHDGVPVTFFGRPAPTSGFPALVARQYQRPLFVATMVRLPHVRFSLRLTQIPLVYTPDRDSDIRELTQAIQNALEADIRATPSQWMWAQRRWG
ncbi:MAG: hypothetical protein KGQ37_06400 [Hyphomicrobiales bacterium]|nr:hypothetical protein [Hyphomicrobiales bacterium]